MRIQVNGEWRVYDGELTVAGLLAAMSLDAPRVAVEKNRSLVPRATFANTGLADGDELEIVTLVGGG